MNGSRILIPRLLETERLLIRAVRPEDAPAAQAAVIASLEALRQWMPWAREGQTLDETSQYIGEAEQRRARGEEFNYFVWSKDGQTFIGATGIHNIDWAVPRFEIGYWLHSDYQGQGYMTEVANRITTMLLEEQGALRIEIRCDAENRRSAAVAERCGYMLEARLRHERRNYKDELADTLIYVRFPED